MLRFARIDFFVASLLFCSGLCYYYFFRDTTVLASWLGIESSKLLSGYAHYFHWFPSFVHPLFFSWVTWIVLEQKHENSVIFFWTASNIVFELLQNGSPVVSLFANSTFAALDLVAIICGAFAAKVLVRKVARRS
jgi:hypothetical protein